MLVISGCLSGLFLGELAHIVVYMSLADTPSISPPMKMFSHSMAALPAFHSLLFLISFLFTTTGSATSLQLSSEIRRFVPSCARRCLLSFIEVSYDNEDCGTTPSLRCLCKTEGLLGFTLGEGAVQCIAGEKAVGGCSDAEGSRELLHPYPFWGLIKVYVLTDYCPTYRG